MIAIYQYRKGYDWPTTKEESEKASIAAQCGLRVAMIALGVIGFMAGVTVLYLLFRP